MRKAAGGRWGLQLHILLGSAGLIAVMMLALVTIPQAMSRQARLEVLRSHVGEVARVAASAVDGDVHRHLMEGGATAAELAAARARLLQMHGAWPEARYVYSMGARNGSAFFVLDTAQDPAFAAKRTLRASAYMEPFQLRAEYASNWLEELAAGHTYVNPDYQYDDYGYFLTGHAPVFAADGKTAGFVGVDFGLDYFLAEEARFKRIEMASILGALLLSLMLGIVYSRHHFRQQIELHRHYESSMNDSLTGLLNRRGADAAIRAATQSSGAGQQRSHAAMLIDIDHFKNINDSFGHAEGDAVIARLARALRAPLHEGAVSARLGGDEFLLFVPDSDRATAERVATQLLDAVREAAGHGGVPFAVSVGVGVAGAEEGGFDLLYSRADSALYQAKAAGKNRYAIHGAAEGVDKWGADAAR